jgi:hypothetical protein
VSFGGLRWRASSDVCFAKAEKVAIEWRSEWSVVADGRAFHWATGHDSAWDLTSLHVEFPGHQEQLMLAVSPPALLIKAGRNGSETSPGGPSSLWRGVFYWSKE